MEAPAKPRVYQPRDGGPAFPLVPEHSAEGMSLRDFFAAHALSGYLAAHGGGDTALPSFSAAAEDAYAVADHMLAERRKLDG